MGPKRIRTKPSCYKDMAQCSRTQAVLCAWIPFPGHQSSNEPAAPYTMLFACIMNKRCSYTVHLAFQLRSVAMAAGSVI